MGGRLAPPVPTVSTPVANNCSNSLDLSVGLSVFYEQMLCQLSLLGKTRDEIQAELVSLEQKMSGLLVNSASATTIEFPSDLNPVIDDLLAGQCKQAAGLLAAPNKNIQIFNTDFNALINDQFETVEKGVVQQVSSLQCGCPGLADLSSGDGDCRSIISELEKIKAAYSAKQTINLVKPAKNPLIGQVSIGGQCYSDVQLAYVPDQSSIQIEPAYGQGASSFGMGNGGNTYLTISLTNAQPGQLASLKAYLFGEGVATGAITGIISPEMMKKIFPNVTQEKINDFLPFINQYLKEFGVNSCEERIHFFTQIAHETINLKTVVEGASSYASSSSKYKGRGMMQLTGSTNYKSFQDYCISIGENVNFVDHPEEVANNPKYVVLSAFWFWENNPSTARNCGYYATDLTEDSLIKVSKAVNCGSINSNCHHNDQNEPCPTCEPIGWDDRKAQFKRIKNEFPCK